MRLTLALLGWELDLTIGPTAEVAEGSSLDGGTTASDRIDPRTHRPLPRFHQRTRGVNMNCKCDDRSHDSIGTTLWHRAFCDWYDSDRAGRGVRAAVWGWTADRLCRWA